MTPSSTEELLPKTGDIQAATMPEPEIISSTTDPDTGEIDIEDSGSLAVNACIQAYNAAYRQAKRKNLPDYDARKAGSRAYREKIPSLLGAFSIGNFIACVSHGLVLGTMEASEVNRLLYAAQVASMAQRRHTQELNGPRPAGRPARSTQPSFSKPDRRTVPPGCEGIRYMGPNDGWAGIDDPELRAWYANHYPNRNEDDVENQS